ncbi:hypothetical protein KDA_13930 [Dictyobacter alpinus]|uniref:Uncharacterized protein n=1 Tax=Dictyobacter alpinus TaxID=2014873 RepID=A0A402B3H9_9CHLR|nr:cytochrome c oxidase subunit 4 [Dictyobacter alpinus]GCE25909.1 hypothetical protein KDA_13930 [Dictyobacter alpinus]
MSQEQKDRVEQSVQAEENDGNVAPLSGTPAPDSAPVEQEPAEATGTATTTTEGQTTRGTTAKKRTRARGRLVNAEEVMPRPSIWPLGMAISIAIALFGVIAGPIVLVIGAVLLLVCCLGWILERR